VCRLQPRRIAKRVAVFAKPPFRQSEVLHEVVARETEIKAWRRKKKLALIRENNPTWEDIAADWGKPAALQFRDTAGEKQVPHG